jgi:hypothetical protein
VTERGTRAAARSGSIGVNDNRGEGNIPADDDDVPPNVWFNDEDPSIIPEDLRREEEVRRIAAKLALKRYKKLKRQYYDRLARGEADGGGVPIRPKVLEPRIWWIRKDSICFCATTPDVMNPSVERMTTPRTKRLRKLHCEKGLLIIYR